jgi:hypothetical protein
MREASTKALLLSRLRQARWACNGHHILGYGYAPKARLPHSYDIFEV